MRVCLGDSCTLWASHSTPSAIPSLKDIKHGSITKGTHDCKHYDNSAGIELAQVRIHTLWVHMDVYKIAHRDFFHYYRCCSLPFERRDPLYLAVSVTDGLHTRIKSTLHLRQWQSILKHNHQYQYR